MKQKNFPARKLMRQLKAKGENPPIGDPRIAAARSVRTKKDRSANSRFNY